MKKALIVLWLTTFFTGGVMASASKSNFFNLEATAIDGKAQSLNTYQGKVVLVVNTASKCGYTPQYQGLQSLYDKYESKGLAVLGFPSNDFGKQEPGTDGEIKQFCDLKYRVKFPLFHKNPVKGPEKQPVYQFLVDHSPKDESGEVQWNFEKFLIDRHGNVVGRFRSKVEPESPELVAAIEKELGH